MTPGKLVAMFLAFPDVRNASGAVIRTRPDARRGFGGVIPAKTEPQILVASRKRRNARVKGPLPLAGSRAGSPRGVGGKAPPGFGYAAPSAGPRHEDLLQMLHNLRFVGRLATKCHISVGPQQKCAFGIRRESLM